ncbi:TPA: ribonuclease HI [Vibrio parahaemolyticus]|uniref:ribonuclease HI n=1 Tax=Vibrio parahaemolyticus TaxID=670 RepID=UPI000FEC858E|nr:ribonuclease HI [Vibrio parahaemolyticus]MCX8885150.1 ribonuclease HI [Vibrio parahaemolyticus]HAS3030131.1 ribonuclease HI [Vibrio parahaemolyticus]HAS3035408.1 ribonuclease HI [Vibrio parahaemolyticus]HAS3040803.1 ribonuclease HI [Vibrio parahaemolyticus]HAS3056872.1 ribonuclease HI [Vibrio parahaemolyticus]
MFYINSLSVERQARCIVKTEKEQTMKNESCALYIAVTASSVGGGIGLVVYDKAGELMDQQCLPMEGYTSNTELELIALVECMQYARDGDVIYTSSDFCARGFNEWIDTWKKKGWRKSDKKPVANRDLWQQVDVLRAEKYVEVNRVTTSNHPALTEAYNMAKQALSKL